MTSYQQQYYDITKRIMEQPHKVGNSRIGKINSRFCEQIRINIGKEYPLMDIKWIKSSNIIHELIWMLRGETNPKYLIENGCHIWTDDAYRYYKEKFSPQKPYAEYYKSIGQQELFDVEMTKEEFVEKILSEEYDTYRADFHMFRYGQLDKIYGYQWRRFNDKTDQVQNVIDKLKSNPDDRRMIITGHNPSDLEDGNVGLPSCHNYMQFYTTINEDGTRNLNTFCNIRSNDWFLGQPYNAPQYALLTYIFANLVDMGVGELVINAVDAHLYHAHFEPAKIWLDRYEKFIDNIDHYSVEVEKHTFAKDTFCKAKIDITNRNQQSIDDYIAEDFKVYNYEPQSYIKAKLLT